MMSRAPRIMLSAGEPSGDALGAGLMRALRDMQPDVQFIGVGGPAMQAAGLFSFFGISELALMGIRDVAPKLRTIFRRIAQTADFAVRTKPDAVVLIDSGDFNHRVARRIRAADPSIRLIKYVSPQIWASRPGRAETMKLFLDHVLCLLPFEPPIYERYGLDATFVGHPALERKPLMVGGTALRRRLGVAPAARLVCVLPGSRRHEVRFLAPAFRDAVARVAASLPDMQCVLPTVPNVEGMVRAATAGWPTPLHIVTGDTDRFAAFDAADAAIAASGTVTTELAVAGVPMIVAYRVGWMTAAIWRRLVNIQHMTIANLVLDRRAIPEFRQEDVKSADMAAALLPLLRGDAAAAEQRLALAEAVAKLDAGESPSRRAAETVLRLVALGPRTAG